MLPYCRSIHNVIEYKISSQHTVVNNFFLVIFFSVFVDKSSKKSALKFFLLLWRWATLLKKNQKPSSLRASEHHSLLGCNNYAVRWTVCILAYVWKKFYTLSGKQAWMRNPLNRLRSLSEGRMRRSMGGLCLAVWQSSFVEQILNSPPGMLAQ